MLSYLSEVCPGDGNYCLLSQSTTLQSCQHCVYCPEFSQYTVFNNQCLLPASSIVLLFAAYWFHHALGKAYGPSQRKREEQDCETGFYLAPHSCICIPGTQTCCEGMQCQGQTWTTTLLAFFLIYNKRTVADCTPALPLTCSQSLLCLFERWKKLQFTLLQESIILEEKNQAVKRHLSHVAPLTFIWR